MKFLWVLIVAAAVLVAADDVDDDDDVDEVNTTITPETGAVNVVDTGSTAGRSRSRRPNGNRSFLGGIGNLLGAGAGLLLGGALGGGGGRPVRPPRPGFGGHNSGFGGNRPSIGGHNSGFGGNRPGFGGQNPGFGGQNPSFGGQNPGFGGQNPGFGGQNPGFGGQHPGFGGQNPGFGGQNPGFGGQNPGFGGQVTGGCRYWCRTPQGQAYCCENSNQGQGGSFPFTKPGQCPPVRPSCPPTRFGPPQTCSSDSRCPGVDKCCFDTCLQEHVCKPPQGVGK